MKTLIQGEKKKTSSRKSEVRNGFLQVTGTVIQLNGQDAYIPHKVHSENARHFVNQNKHLKADQDVAVNWTA